MCADILPVGRRSEKEEIRVQSLDRVEVMKSHQHDFKRDRNASFCFICQDAWPANETAVSKYDACAICGLDEGFPFVFLTKNNVRSDCTHRLS
jgi:hypothetical protein